MVKVPESEVRARARVVRLEEEDDSAGDPSGRDGGGDGAVDELRSQGDRRCAGEDPREREAQESRAQGLNSTNSLLPISLSVHAHSGEALTCCDLQEDAPKCLRTTRAA
jgi:hypothetical protein